MSVVIGVNPGGRGAFAISALLYTGRLPAMLVDCRSYSGVKRVLDDMLGIIGEWGDLAAAAIDAPLTWSGEESGWRECDKQVREQLPSWAPKSWMRSPNAMAGAVAVQGPALTWAMAYEAKRGMLGTHAVCETHARAGLANIAGDLKNAVLNVGKRGVNAKTKAKHLDALLHRFVDPGIVKIELGGTPSSAEELNAMICAVTALAHAFPETGLVTQTYDGAPIRPVGKRSMVVLSAFP